jgi:hypothetical protein
MAIWMIYTAWALVIATGLLWRLVRGPKCGHDWEPVVERELPAVAEIIEKSEIHRFVSAIVTYNAGRKKYFALVSCKKCGELREFTTLSGADPT